jgi:O-antigen/teichoic acid export membrane protein
MNIIHRSVGFSAVDRYGSTLFQIVSLAILARLLTPREFGVYTMVYAFTALATVSYWEFGGANYLIQKSGLTEEGIRTAFTISLAMSCAFALILFGLRNLAAIFYAQEGLRAGIATAALRPASHR